MISLESSWRSSSRSWYDEEALVLDDGCAEASSKVQGKHHKESRLAIPKAATLLSIWLPR